MVKFSVYLNRHVFVMECLQAADGTECYIGDPGLPSCAFEDHCLTFHLYSKLTREFSIHLNRRVFVMLCVGKIVNRVIVRQFFSAIILLV